MGLSNLFGGSSEPEANASPDTTQAFQNMRRSRAPPETTLPSQELAGAAMGQVVAMMGETPAPTCRAWSRSISLRAARRWR